MLIYKLLLSDINAPVNIGNPEEITVRELAETIKRMVKSKSKIVFRPLPKDDPAVRQPDISLARRALKWKPEISLLTGLKYTLKYFRSELG